MSTNPLLEKLGYPADARLVIFHADDVGMCHGANVAFLDCYAAGMLKAGSVMLPCPWSREILNASAANPALDLGVHITLNAEWDAYRWGPLSTRDPQSGLLDEQGYFWHRPHMLLEHINVEATIREMQTQVEYAHAAGLDFTHIDAHMGAAQSAPLFEAYIELGFANQVPVLLCRQMDDYMRMLGVASVGEERYMAAVAAAEARGMPLVDTFRITPGYDATGEGGRQEYYENVLRNLPSGITYFSLHPNAPGEIETLTPKAHWRTLEHQYFQSQDLRDLLAAEGIVSIGYREIRDIMRAGA